MDYGRFNGERKKQREYSQKAYNNEAIPEKSVNILLDRVRIKPRDFNGISFCIPTNGKRAEKTGLLFRSIKKQKGKPFEVIVCGDIDNFRNEKDIALIEQKAASHTGRVGLLRNRAADKAKYDVIVWCDDDMVLDPDWMERTIDYSEHNGWEVLGNRILNPDGTRHWDRCTRTPHVLVGYDYPEDSENLIQTSGFFCVRKEVFNWIKWDEDCLIYSDREKRGVPEDLKFSLDLHEKNYAFKFNGDTRVWHNDDLYTQFNLRTIKKDLMVRILVWMKEILVRHDRSFRNLVELLEQEGVR